MVSNIHFGMSGTISRLVSGKRYGIKECGLN